MKFSESLLVLACGAGIALPGRGSLRAETTASSDAIGYYRKTLVPGYQSVSVSMVKKPVFTSAIEVSTATTLTSTFATANFAPLLVPGQEHYVEIVAGPTGVTDPYVGHRFEVNESATTAAANAQLVLDTGSPVNTIATVPDLAGYTMEVRSHWTLNEIFDKTQLVGGTSLGTADQVLTFSNGNYETYYVLASGAVRLWVRFGVSPTSQDAKPLYPGQGMLFKRSAGAGNVEIMVKGKVRSNPFYQKLNPGYNLVSEGFPVTVSPLIRGAAPGNFTGSVSVNSADQISVLEGSAYTTYYLFKSGSTSLWLKLGGSGTHNTSPLFDYTGSVFLRRITADSNYRIPLPWVP